MGRLDGRVAIITGAASGIGRATAERFVEEGARVFAADLDGDGIGRLVAQLGHNQVDGAVTDVTDEAAVEALVAAAVRRFGRIDIAFNNAGIGGFAPIQDYPLGDFRRVVDVSLVGAFLCTKHVAKRMIAAGRGGSIINMASLNAVQPAEGFAAYCAAKAAVAMLTGVAALELGRHRIRVNAIAPGLVETPATEGLRANDALRDAFHRNTPLGRHASPAEIAAVAAFLASDDASFVTGELLHADGGQRLKKYPELFR
jgi:NAD(P)-dependent dehydrogenase (short-subunit alcohol dehydrogenase family)